MNRKKHNIWKRIVVLALCLFMLFPFTLAASEKPIPAEASEISEETKVSEMEEISEERKTLELSESSETSEEQGESEMPETSEEPKKSKMPETSEEPEESEIPEISEESESPVYVSQTFLDMSEEEQILYIQGLDETAFYELLENLIDNDNIVMVSEEGFVLTEAFWTEDETEEPILSDVVLRALEEKWLETEGGVMTLSMNENTFNPTANVQTETAGGVTKFILTGDVTVNGQIQISNNENYTIDLSGHTMEMSNNGCYFMINPGGTLTIEDSAGGGVVYNKTYLVWLYNGGTFNLKSGTIDGSKVTSKPQMGGAVYFGSPMNGDEVFNMYGGTIRNCSSTQSGGAVYVAPPSSGHSCYFNMYGGSILDCSSQSGGAIYVGSQGTDRSAVHLEGKSKITLLGNRATGRGGAIYSDGKVEISGILDIGHGKSAETECDSIYIDKNNWSGYVPEYLDVTGRLVVVGDGYIDLDTNYPAANAVVQGHTVVKNSAGLTPEEFYTYGSYFINSELGLTVSAGFDPSKNSTTSEPGPGNWHTYNSDTGNYEHQTYVDVMGQTMYVEATSEPGKRQYQDYNYLIYTERNTTTDPILELKQDEDGSELDGAEFSLSGTIYDVYGAATSDKVSGVSGETGIGSGVSTGETYIYTDNTETQKLMLRDGIYTITETRAPTDYMVRENFMEIKIGHDNTGEASVVVVSANNMVLTETSVSIGRSGDAGQLVEHEIVLTVTNSKEQVETDPIEWKLSGKKYGTQAVLGNEIAGAQFGLYGADAADGAITDTLLYTVISGSNGTFSFHDNTGSSAEQKQDVSLQAGTYYLRETSAPQGYQLAKPVKIVIGENGTTTAVYQADANGDYTINLTSGNEDEDPSAGGAKSAAAVDSTNHTISVSIVDEALYSLPETGGRGIYMGLMLSILLMCAAGTGWRCLRRKVLR